jgi:hypothetical protein
VAFYCEEQISWPGSEFEEAQDCVDLENLAGKYGELSFVPATDFSNDSGTGKFVLELESNNDSIRRKVLSEQQLSHLMKHKIQFLVNGVWLEHDAKDALFPIVSIRNSTGNELEVLYVDCSLADINLQFLDLFDFTSTFVFWCYVVEGIGVVFVLVIFIVKKIGCPPDIGDVVLFIIFPISLGLSHISSIFYFFPKLFAVNLNFFTNWIWILLVLCWRVDMDFREK